MAASSGASILVLFLFGAPVTPAHLTATCILVGLCLGRRVLSPIVPPEEPLTRPYIPGGSDES